jgi:muconolactone delta-isomerase
MKFLIMWELDLASPRREMMHAVLKMPDYTKRVREMGKLVARYHLVGRHGGAWIYDVDSNEELERILAMAPVFNYARYQVHPLAEMDTPATVFQGEPAS